VTAERVRVRISIPESSTIDEKIDFLMRRRDEMVEALDNLYDKVDEKINEINGKIKIINETIAETKKLLNEKISEVAISNYDLRLFSIISMICGTFLQILI